MHAVVNELTLAKPIDEALLAKVRTFYQGLRDEPEIVDTIS